MSAKDKAYDIAKENGWSYLGKSEVKIEVPITDFEKLELGKSQAESLGRINELENQLVDIKKEFKGKIEAHQFVVKSTAQILRDEKKITHKSCPFYLSRDRALRYWVDPDTGQVVQETAAEESDKQLRIG